MIPLVSYLWLRGKCRNCGSAISPRVLVVELATGLLFVAIYLTYGIEGDFAVLAVATALMLALAIIDLERGLILNRIVFPSMVVALVLAPFWPELGFERGFPGIGGPLESFVNSLTAGAGAFLAFWAVAIAFPRGMGGGDVKMSGLIGLLVGFPGVLTALWTAALGGGIVAIALIAAGKRGRKDTMPFGPFLAAGAVVALVWGDDIISGYEGLVSAIGPYWI